MGVALWMDGAVHEPAAQTIKVIGGAEKMDMRIIGRPGRTPQFLCLSTRERDHNVHFALRGVASALSRYSG